MRKKFTRSWFATIFSFFVSFACFYLYRVSFTSNLVPYTQVTSEFTGAVKVTTKYKYVTKSLDELGTPKLNEYVLFLNQIPKCGAEVLILLLQKLQGVNNFQHLRLPAKNKLISKLEQELLVEEVTNIIKNKAIPLTFDQQMHFINFTSFGRQSPKFINLIRDPIDVFVSKFFYNKLTPNSNRVNIHSNKNFNNRYFTKSLENCVIKKEKECTFKTGMLYDLVLSYFCGQNPKCAMLNNDWALSIAKSNVDKYYPVVGVLEEFNTTLQVFESTIPFFFTGIQQLYFNDLLLPHKKDKITSQIKNYIQNHLKNIFLHEYEFYEWIKMRLFKQLQMINGHSH